MSFRSASTLRRLAIITAALAMLAPAATAQAQDLRSPDTVDAATLPATATQDMRTPDSIDAADGRGPGVQDLRSPDAQDPMRPVQAPEVPSANPGGFDWPSAGIGAAILGALLIGALTIATGVRRTRAWAI